MKTVTTATNSSKHDDRREEFANKFTACFLGFTLSLALTLVAYSLVRAEVLAGWVLMLTLIAMALTQLIVQLLFFLHMRHEAEPRWKLLVFDFMLLIVTIFVFGTLWIMNNLNYHMMSPQQTNDSIVKDEGITL